MQQKKKKKRNANFYVSLQRVSSLKIKLKKSCEKEAQLYPLSILIERERDGGGEKGFLCLIHRFLLKSC